MTYSITFAKEINSNTSEFLTICYPETEELAEQAIRDFRSALAKQGVRSMAERHESKDHVAIYIRIFK